MNNEELWQAALARLQFTVSLANFASWFRQATVLDKKGDTVVIGTPNAFSKSWLESKYHKQILEALREVSPDVKKVQYKVSTSTGPKNKPPVSVNPQQIALDAFQPGAQSGLNPRYTFKDFVVADFNEVPYAAADAVAQNPGHAYNPLFIYGGVGLGKTHLLQAIGNEVSQNDEDGQAKIKYMSAGKLISMIVSGIQKKSIEAMKEEFQQLDMLIVDDIQFVAGKEKTQEEFFHIFNVLYNKNSQIVLSSDRMPSAIPTLAKRLQSRFEGGMVADISRPNYESRLAILSNKMESFDLDLSQEVLNYIATNVQKNVRELEGALKRLGAHQKRAGRELGLAQVKRILKDLTRGQVKTANPDKIISCVASFYNLNSQDLLSGTRRKEVAYPRQVAMYLLRKDLKKPFTSIGQFFGGRDHTTVIYAYNKIEEEVGEEASISEDIEAIRQRIYGEGG